MVSPAIPSLAILKVNWDTFGKDYIENFVPFAVQCIISLKCKVISARDMQSRMLDEFGIRIPQNGLKVILNRAAKRGYITKQQNAYIPNKNKLAEFDFETIRQRVLREHNAIIDKLLNFSSKNFNMILNKEDAEKALLSYIAEHQIEILSSAVNGAPISRVTKSDRKTELLVHAFIIYLYENDPEGFEYLDTIVKGNMLANVFWYPDIGRVQSGFQRTEVYCDTAFLIRAIGLEGRSSQEPCKELLDLLYEKGADIRCFRHTLDEIRNILYACLNRLLKSDFSGGYGHAFRYLIDTGYTPSDVQLEITSLEKKLERFKIKVVEKPEYQGRFQIDEEALEQTLKTIINYSQERALIHDVDCLSAIYRLRKGRDCYYIENCLALFLTTNNALVRVSWEFFNRESDTAVPIVPIAMTDHSLTSILWLKKPMSAPNLPRKHIIADCYAAMEPSISFH